MEVTMENEWIRSIPQQKSIAVVIMIVQDVKEVEKNAIQVTAVIVHRNIKINSVIGSVELYKQKNQCKSNLIQQHIVKIGQIFILIFSIEEKIKMITKYFTNE